jgi:hypothetical protein
MEVKPVYNVGDPAEPMGGILQRHAAHQSMHLVPFGKQ